MSPSELALRAQGMRAAVARADRVVLAIAAILAGLLALAPGQVSASLLFVLRALEYIAPFLLLAVFTASSIKAVGLDRRAAAVFRRGELAAIGLAAAFGTLSPFCSCSAVPIVTALLVAGAPLAPVMAFWIASPLMDPEMFILTAAVFDLPFAAARAVAALAMGLLAGLATYALTRRGLLAHPLKAAQTARGVPGAGTTQEVPLVWRFWAVPERRRQFLGQARSFGWFLLKWLTLAFLLESLILAYVPQEAVTAWLGGDQPWAVPAGVLAGVPAYLNGYAAIPTVSALMDSGMAAGPALAFMVAGGVTSSPAAVMVFAAVRRAVFAWYLVLGFAGSLLVGFAYQGIVGG